MSMLKKLMALSAMATSMLFAGNVSAKFSDLYIEAKGGTCTQQSSCVSTALDFGYEWNKKFATEIGSYASAGWHIPDGSTSPTTAGAHAGGYAAGKLMMPLQSKLTPYAKLGITGIGYGTQSSSEIKSSTTLYSAIGLEYKLGKRWYVIGDVSFVPHNEKYLAFQLGFGF
jgi:hypothetical protein